MTSSRARHSHLRKFLLALLILLVLAAVLIAAAPTLISGPGRGLVLDRVNAALAGRIELDGLEIGWAGPQRIRGLRVFDPAGTRVLEVGAVDIDGSLIGLVMAPHCNGEIAIHDVAGEIVVDDDGATNLARVAGPGAPAEDSGPAGFGNLRGMDCRVRLDDAGLDLRAPGMAPIGVSQMATTAHLKGLESLELEIDAAVKQGDSRGRVGGRAEATGLFDARARLDPARAEFDFNLDADQFPVDMIDRLAGLGGRLRAVLGPAVDQRVEGQWRGAEGRLALEMQGSAGARAQTEFAIRDGAVALERPAEIVVGIRPEAWKVLAPGGARLLAPFEVEARLDTLAWNPADGVAALDARLDVGDIELEADDGQIGRLALRETRLSVTSEDLREGLAIELDTLAEQDGRGGRARLDGRLAEFLGPDLAPTPENLRLVMDGKLTELPLAVLDQFAGGDGLLSGALGPRMNAEFHLDSVPAQGGGEFNLTGQSAHLRVGVSGQLEPDGLALDTGRVGLDVQPALVARLTDALALAEPAALDLQVQRFRVPRRAGALAWSESEVGMVAELAEARASAGGGPPVHLEGTLNAASDRLADGLALDFDGRLGDAQAQGSIQAVVRLDGSMALREAARIELSDFPVGVIDRLAEQRSRVAALLGESMALELKLEPAPDGAFGADVVLDSDLMNARLSARGDGQRLSVDSGAELEWRLTPAAFAAFQTEPEWTLVQPSSVAVRLDRLEAELGGDGLDMRSLAVVAEARMAELTIRRGEETPLRFADMNVLADGRPLAERLELRANADLGGGRFHSESALSGLIDADGALVVGNARMQTDTRFEEVPTELLLALGALDPALAPALGPTARARVSGRVPGALEVRAEGANTRVSAQARIDANGVLGLERDAELTLNVTPPLIDGYLARLHPFLNDVRSAEQPIRLALSADGFRLPLAEYRPGEISARGRLEIGTLNMNRGAITLGLFGALQQLGGNPRLGSNFQARFTSLEFSVSEGQVKTNDLWMQMEGMMLGARARIRLPERPDAMPHAEMEFAVPGQTLRGLPRVADSIAPDTILTTSASGPINQISPNFSKLFAGLATQSAIEQVAGDSDIGNAIGSLLGGGRERRASGDRDPARSQGAARSRWPNMPPIDTGEDAAGGG